MLMQNYFHYFEVLHLSKGIIKCIDIEIAEHQKDITEKEEIVNKIIPYMESFYDDGLGALQICDRIEGIMQV